MNGGSNTKNIRTLENIKSILEAPLLGLQLSGCWNRFDYKQAEYASCITEEGRFTFLKSYNTIVAVFDVDAGVLYELGKYSVTTSKQVTQFFNKHLYGTRVLLDKPEYNYISYSETY